MARGVEHIIDGDDDRENEGFSESEGKTHTHTLTHDIGFPVHNTVYFRFWCIIHAMLYLGVLYVSC